MNDHHPNTLLRLIPLATQTAVNANKHVAAASTRRDIFSCVFVFFFYVAAALQRGDITISATL